MSLGTGMRYRKQGAIARELQYRIKRELQTIVSIGPASLCANVSNKCFKQVFQAGVDAGGL